MKIYYLLIPVALIAGFFAANSKTISQTPQAFAEEYLAKIKTKGKEMDNKGICREVGGRFYSLAPLTSYTIKQVMAKNFSDLEYHELNADITTSLTQGGTPQRQEGEQISQGGRLSDGNGTWGTIVTYLPGKSIYPPVPVNSITLEIWKSDDYYEKHKLKYPGVTRDYISKNLYCIAYPRNWSNSVNGQWMPVGALDDLVKGFALTEGGVVD
jgi:hypothetical protein